MFRLRLDGLDRPSGRITATVLLQGIPGTCAVVTAPRINTANAVAMRSSRRTIIPPFEHALPDQPPNCRFYRSNRESATRSSRRYSMGILRYGHGRAQCSATPIMTIMPHHFDRGPVEKIAISRISRRVVARLG